MHKILVIGKQNVGKSTFINRLLRKRKSIQASVAGVTRDYISYPWQVGSHHVSLIDSAGITTDAADSITKDAIARTFALLDSAHLILFVLSVVDVTGEDIELSLQLQPYREKVVIIANKIDLSGDLSDVYSLGFPTILSISAEHNTGISKLMDFLELRIGDIHDDSLEQSQPESAASSEEASNAGFADNAEPTDIAVPEQKSDQKVTPRVCVVGRPNVGKSSLLNALVGFDRAIVSDIPGTTRDSVAHAAVLAGTEHTIVDTAGIRRKRRHKSAIEFYSQVRSEQSYSDADCCMVLIDSSEGVTEQDMTIVRNLELLGRPYVVLCNKWDLIQEKEGYAMIRKVKDRHGLFRYAMIFPCSVKNRVGLEYIPSYIRDLLSEAKRTVTTGTLNSYLQRWIRQSPPKSSKTKNITIRYGTQTGVNPPQFVFFANKYAKEFKTYARYIESCLRRTFGFLHVPIRIEIRTPSNVRRRRT